VEEIAHRVDEDLARLFPAQRLRQNFVRRLRDLASEDGIAVHHLAVP
jgi:hypothetical protein